ncbi:MAG: hypothetical protein IT384_33590, partial [Deltaproteobacteria bacterium]|nr:hypothetical protein [Deltaproteobacteria bacterium]
MSSARLGTNGVLLFDSQEAIGSSNPAPGQTALPNAFIAPFWDDLIISSGEPGVIAYQVDGIAPARRITFEWREVDRYSGTEPKMSFSVRLFEGPAGRMEIDYGAVNTQAAVTLSGTMAMEDAAGERAIYFHPTACTSDCDLTALGAQQDTRVALALDFGIDLAAVDLDVPPTLYQGAPAAASVVIANLHRASLGPFR